MNSHKHTLNLTVFLYLSSTSALILSNPHNTISFHETIKIRGNNPILTLKHNIFLHISLTSTLISFKPS